MIKKITLNEESVWTGQPVDREIPNAGNSLSKVRELLFQEEYSKAEKLVQKKMMSDPIEGHAYQALGNWDRRNVNLKPYGRD